MGRMREQGRRLAIGKQTIRIRRDMYRGAPCPCGLPQGRECLLNHGRGPRGGDCEPQRSRCDPGAYGGEGVSSLGTPRPSLPTAARNMIFPRRAASAGMSCCILYTQMQVFPAEATCNTALRCGLQSAVLVFWVLGPQNWYRWNLCRPWRLLASQQVTYLMRRMQ